MISYIGKVFWDKNLIFKKNGYTHTKQLDHASKRPVLIIAESDEYIYYLRISSHPGKSSTDIQLINEYGEHKNSFVSVNQIFRKPICFIKTTQIIGNSKMLEILIMLKRYNRKIEKDEYYDEIKEQIDNLINQYSIQFDGKTKNLKIK